MAYEPRSTPGPRLGLFADKIAEKREELGRDESGFRRDGTDPLKEEKEMLRRLLARGRR